MKNNLLFKHRFGFCAVHWTVTRLYEATDWWAFNVDRGLNNAVVFLDLKKAFDTVDHEILLFKLGSYGIRPKLSNKCSRLRSVYKTETLGSKYVLLLYGKANPSVLIGSLLVGISPYGPFPWKRS